MNYVEILKKLWIDYSKLNPSVNRIHSLLGEMGEKVVNDHIAFRTFDIDYINIDTLAEIFIEVGYKEKANYLFKEKHLRARHYEHSDLLAPKIFISELIIAEFSPYLQRIAHEVADFVKDNGVTRQEIIFSKNTWGPASYNTYEKLREESEYAAWLYVFGFRANHFTVFVNHLKTINSIEELNEIVKANHFNLNSAGGEIKGSEKVMLKQSSTLADKITVDFIEGSYEIPCCYYEFAQRFNDSDGNLFNGFIAKSADKIFESTNKTD